MVDHLKTMGENLFYFWPHFVISKHNTAYLTSHNEKSLQYRFTLIKMCHVEDFSMTELKFIRKCVGALTTLQGFSALQKISVLDPQLPSGRKLYECNCCLQTYIVCESKIKCSILNGDLGLVTFLLMSGITESGPENLWILRIYQCIYVSANQLCRCERQTGGIAMFVGKVVYVKCAGIQG